MPKHVSARAAQDEREGRKVRKLAGSQHAPADWKFHAQIVVESWAGKTPQAIALVLHCHPQTVRIHLNPSMRKESTVWECGKERDASLD